MTEPIIVTSYAQLDALVALHIYEKAVEWISSDCAIYLEDTGQKAFLPKYSRLIMYAWPIAEKLGLALVPQSRCGNQDVNRQDTGVIAANGDGFNWFCCDIDHVFYGDEICLAEKNDSGISQPTAPLAICLAALKSVGVEVELKIEDSP